MASQGSQTFSTMELLGMEKNKIHDKHIRIGVAHLTSMSTKQCDSRSFFVSSERPLPDLKDTLWCVIFVIQNFKIISIFKNIEFSSLLFSFEHCNFYFYFSTYFFDYITLCINLPNATISNMSHLVYLTLFGETDGVTLPRLGRALEKAKILSSAQLTPLLVNITILLTYMTMHIISAVLLLTPDLCLL